MHKLLVSPAHRVGACFRQSDLGGISRRDPGRVIYLSALVVAHSRSLEAAFHRSALLFAVMLGSAIFATFSLIIACLVKSRERFMGIGQLMTMPLFFASNAIYPIAIMPRWLQVVAVANPLTYLVDALRGLMICQAQSLHSPLMNFSVIGAIFVCSWPLPPSCIQRWCVNVRPLTHTACVTIFTKPTSRT